MLVEALEARRMLAAPTLVLMNADTNKSIEPLSNGIILDLATLPTRHLNVRADATSDTGSVKFTLDGATHLENVAPYALAGDDNGWMRSWTPPLGTHNLTAAAWTLDNAAGS